MAAARQGHARGLNFADTHRRTKNYLAKDVCASARFGVRAYARTPRAVVALAARAAMRVATAPAA